MTTPVPVPPLIQAAPWPALGSANYNDEAYAAGVTQPAAFARQAEIGEAGYANALSAEESAQAAQQSAIDATNAAAPALAASHFKGLWTEMTGLLNKPASVKHQGRFWMLLANLADVATSEPGVSADWTALDAGTGVSQTITTAGATVNAVAGVCYALAAADITLVYPAVGQLKRDYIGIRLCTDPGTQIIDFNGNRFRGRDAGQRVVDLQAFGLDTYYEDAARGYI